MWSVVGDGGRRAGSGWPGGGGAGWFVSTVEQRRILAEALEGVELGAWDERIVDWLAGWDSCTVLTIASWLARARGIERSR